MDIDPLSAHMDGNVVRTLGVAMNAAREGRPAGKTQGDDTRRTMVDGAIAGKMIGAMVQLPAHYNALS